MSWGLDLDFHSMLFSIFSHEDLDFSFLNRSPPDTTMARGKPLHFFIISFPIPSNSTRQTTGDVLAVGKVFLRKGIQLSSGHKGQSS